MWKFITVLMFLFFMLTCEENKSIIQPSTKINLSGQVISGYNNDPISGVVVILSDMSVITNSRGYFFFWNIPSGKSLIHVKKESFLDQEIQISLCSDTTIVVSLQPNMVDYFPTSIGSTWLYDLDFYFRDEYNTIEAIGTLETHLNSIRTTLNDTSYLFSAIVDCEWKWFWWEPGHSYDSLFHRVDETTFIIKDVDGELWIQEPSQRSIIYFFSKMFNWLHPFRYQPEYLGTVQLQWIEGSYGTIMFFSDDHGLENFWGDTGGTMIAWKEYTTLTLDLIEYNQKY